MYPVIPMLFFHSRFFLFSDLLPDLLIIFHISQSNPVVVSNIDRDF